MKKKEDIPKKGAPAYMNTYGDMMTLILCFFVLLFSMSTIDAQKFQQLVNSFSSQISIFDGGQSINNTSTIMQNGMSQMPIRETTFSIQDSLEENRVLQETEEDLSSYVKSNNMDESIDVEREGNTVVIRFLDGVLFDSGEAQIKAGAIPTLNMMGKKVKSYMDKGYILCIEGHTDNRPIANAQFPSNWELSSGRSLAVMRFYVDHMDFDVTKITCAAWADQHPIATNDTPEGRAKNRRVELKLSLPLTE